MAHILVDDVTPLAKYSSGAGQTEFIVPWPFFTDASLQVWQTASGGAFDESGDLLSPSTEYSVTGAGNVAGVERKITLTAPAGAGDTITILRSEPIARTSDYQNSGDLLAETLNDEQDLVVMILQQLREQVSRSVKISTFETADTTLPTPAPSTFFRWNSAGDALENVSTVDLATALGISLIEMQSYNASIVSTAGQTVFDIETAIGQPFIPGQFTLMIHINGVYQQPATSYTESPAGDTITFSEPLDNGDLVSIKSTSFLDSQTSLDAIGVRASATVAGTTYAALTTTPVILVDDDTAGAPVTVSLPAANVATGRTFSIKKLGSTANVVIDPNGSETIDGAAILTLTSQYESVDAYSNGTFWSVL